MGDSCHSRFTNDEVEALATREGCGLNLSTTDIGAGLFCALRIVLCLIGYSAASLAFT